MNSIHSASNEIPVLSVGAAFPMETLCAELPRAHALFDLATDPGEQADMLTRHPDIFEQIKKQYLAWNAQMLPRPAE